MTRSTSRRANTRGSFIVGSSVPVSTALLAGPTRCVRDSLQIAICIADMLGLDAVTSIHVLARRFSIRGRYGADTATIGARSVSLSY